MGFLDKLKSIQTDDLISAAKTAAKTAAEYGEQGMKLAKEQYDRHVTAFSNKNFCGGMQPNGGIAFTVGRTTGRLHTIDPDIWAWHEGEDCFQNLIAFGNQNDLLPRFLNPLLLQLVNFWDMGGIIIDETGELAAGIDLIAGRSGRQVGHFGKGGYWLNIGKYLPEQEVQELLPNLTPELRQFFFNVQAENDLSDALQYVIVIQPPVNTIVLKAIKRAFFNVFEKRRTDRTLPKNFAFFVCNNYEQIAEPDDKLFFSNSKDFRCVSVLASSSVSSMAMAIESTSFLNSFKNQVFFPTQDSGTLEQIRKIAPNHASNILHEMTDGTAYCHLTIENEEVSDIFIMQNVTPSMLTGLQNTAPKWFSKSELDSCIDELNSMIGLDTVKAEVLTLLNTLQMRTKRAKAGLPNPPMSLHLVFTGRAGTGKTTVARIIGVIYRNLGILSSGHVIETDRAGLVGGYMGQTALKTQDVVAQAYGGVLFIDEAYSLVQYHNQQQDYGEEAITVILKAMEDYRDNFVVIVAGYPDKMQEFLQSNQGLPSRFTTTIHFPDYTPQELVDIFKVLCAKNKYKTEAGIESSLLPFFEEEVKKEDFSNGRTARNAFERVMKAQSNRLAISTSASEGDLQTITKADIETALRS